ncbi:beta-galactosidase BgaS [Thermofilum pendens]|uniref:Glycoside hydrolase, family 1 n=1 Tax=Thermofilum pendens (strain DSM 2475 / Hrk 5) TaxID=368408 RepID=A1RZ79_THEPD|nr:beta-galactosidase BgaS [Thermofilum pendens]ABL78509.1 glycoside hydrolase, family 1 [Thermofilum pendens Hrk 5]
MFPKSFLWGVSLAGFQFEMGDPAGEALDPNTDWYVWVHDEYNIREGIVSGDLPEKGIDYWHLFREDHSLAKSLGLNAYRLNVEWSRVFPEPTFSVEVGVEEEDGVKTGIDIDDSDLEKLDSIANKKAVQHYREVVEDLREKGFYVILNLVHFTLPTWIHDPLTARATNAKKGPLGYADPRFPVEFAKFAAYVAASFGDLVDAWSTFNEPSVVTESGFLKRRGKFPPGIFNFDAYKRAMINIAQAHLLAYIAIKKFDRVKAYSDSAESASVGIIHNMIPFHPLDPSRKRDRDASMVTHHLHNSWIPNSLVNGWIDRDFDLKQEPSEVFEKYKSRLDWMGINYYSRSVVKGKVNLLRPVIPFPAFPVLVKGYGFECAPNSQSLAGRPTTDFGWEVYPEGIVEVVKMAMQYNVPLLVTENGVADARDELRPHFLALHLKLLEDALESREISLKGYLHWALTDNYEWADGFRMRFGLFEVDLSSKRRVKRPSADLFARIVSEGTVPDEAVRKAREKLSVNL